MKLLYSHRTKGLRAEGAHIAGISNGFRELGFEVEVLAPPGFAPETSRAPQQRTPVVDNRSQLISGLTRHAPEVLFELLEVTYNIIALFRTWQKIRTGQCTLIYERYSMFLFINTWLARHYGIPFILEVNDSCLVERMRPLRMKWLAKRIEAWIFSNVSVLAFISNAFLSTAREAYPNLAKAVVCPNGIDPHQFDPDIDAKQLRQTLGLEGARVCGYFGVFAPWHGIEWFVQMAGQRILDNPQAKHPTFMLVGDGPLHSTLTAWVEAHELTEHFIFTGRVPHTDIPRYIAAMDFGVLPASNLYGSPMKVIESMAMGVPMVAPNLGPVEEVIADTETGWLFEAEHHQAAIDLVWHVAAAPDEILQIGARARDYIHRERLWVKNVESCLAALEPSLRPDP